MTKRKISCVSIGLLAILVILYIVFSVYFRLEDIKETSDVYMVQRALLHELIGDIDNISDGDIFIDKYVVNMDNALKKIAKNYHISATKNQKDLDIIITGKDASGKNINLREKFIILPSEKTEQHE